MRTFMISLAIVAWMTASAVAAPKDANSSAIPKEATVAPPATVIPPAPSEALAPGEAYIVPARPNAERHGGFVVVDSILGREEPAAPGENAHKRPAASPAKAPESPATYDQQLKAFLRGFGVYPDPDGTVPLTGDVVQALCDYGPGHPLLCPARYQAGLIQDKQGK